MGKWTRRAFIGAGAATGGGLVLGLGGILFAPNRLRVQPDGDSGELDPDGDTPRLTTWIRITPDNRVVAIIPHCEMGQGALTGIAMMLAEELDADWDLLEVQEAPADDAYANGYLIRGFAEEAGIEYPNWMERALDFAAFKVADIAGFQTTGGSSATRSTGWHGMRIAGATARAMLLEAAADRLEAPASELTTSASHIRHEPSGRTLTYGEVAADAAELGIPRNPRLKDRSEYRLVGTSPGRVDIPTKVTGEATYGIDIDLPDMVYAAIAASPVRGATLVSVDEAPALAIPGIHSVVRLEDAVVVVADGYWAAQRGLDALSPEFTSGDLAGIDTNAIRAEHLDAVRTEDPDGPEETGSDIVVEYTVPYLAHATMEPMAATARVQGEHIDVWAGTQDPLNAKRAAAGAGGVSDSQVTLHNLQLGGGFGRRLPGAHDYVEQAVRVAQATAPRPVKLVWSREEDMRHGYYRPFVAARMRADLGSDGSPTRWVSRFTGTGFDRMSAAPVYPDVDRDLRAAGNPSHLRTGSWRSVAYSQHGFFNETFVDELAHAARRDPMEYRRSLLGNAPRHRAVLDRVAELAGWGSPLAEGRARGVAIVESFGTVVAEVAEVGLTDSGQIRVFRVDAVGDCGLVVNPDQAEAQIQGGIVFGVSAALFHEITVSNGAVEQASFPSYPMITLADAPVIRVEFLESAAPMGGLGEPGVPPVAPAIGNALFALTGTRYRSLPFKLV